MNLREWINKQKESTTEDDLKYWAIIDNLILYIKSLADCWDNEEDDVWDEA